jgi:hypothetical protein
MRIDLVKVSKILLLSLLLTSSWAVLSQDDPSSADSRQEITEQIDRLTTAQFDDPPVAESPRVNTLEEADKRLLEYRLAQEDYIYKEVMVLALMAVVSLTIVLTFMKINGACKPRDMVISAGLILVIFSTIILVLVADSQEQISAAIGVLGAIAGYLFGTASSRKPEVEAGSSENKK